MAREQAFSAHKKKLQRNVRVLAPNFTPTGCVPTVTVGACSFTALLLSVKSDGGDSGPLSPVLTLEQTEKKFTTNAVPVALSFCVERKEKKC
jgi:hypothetical protein